MKTRSGFQVVKSIIALGLSGLGVGCTTAAGDATAPPSGANVAAAPAIAHVHATVCGSCHTRIEPGTRTRTEIESALARHHRRVHLSQVEWRAMVDYLALPAGELVRRGQSIAVTRSEAQMTATMRR